MLEQEDLQRRMTNQEKQISKELLEKRARNSEAAKRCRDRVKQKIEILEKENQELLQEKRNLYLKLVQSDTMLQQSEQSLKQANERIEMLESRLTQFQRFLLQKQQEKST